VAELNVAQLSQLALRNNYGGIAGHYLLIGKKLIQRHQDAGQKIGTGFISSKSLLYREVNRKVDWLFTDNALSLSTWLQT
jgi:glycerophosphoryl diester phosphodiesterase